MDHRIVIIGGGPIGAATARFAAEEGANVLLVERRAKPSAIPACTGLVSPRTLAALGVSNRSVLRKVRAVTAHAPAGRALPLRSDELKAVVLDRSALEAELLALAASAGAEVRPGAEARLLGDGRIEIESRAGTETIEAAVVIGADGPNGAVARAGGLATDDDFHFGIQATIEDQASDSDHVDVYFEPDASLFAWRVPAERGSARVGLLVPPGGDPAALLDGLLTRRFAGKRVLSRAGGRIPSAPLPRTVSGRVLLVGDAAGQVKPLSGGGLYTGAVCARLAGHLAAEATASWGGAERVLSSYDPMWRDELGQDLAFGQTMRSVLAATSTADLDTLFAILDDDDILRFLADEGDIDHTRRLLSEISRRPALWGKLIGLLSLIDQRKIDALIARPAVAPASQPPL